MPLFEAVADGVMTNFLTSVIIDGSKYIISNIWNGDSDLENLRATLVKDLRGLRTTINNINSSLGHLDLPSDWLNELDNCRYEMEDIEESMRPEHKKELVRRCLETNIKCIAEMQDKLRKREEDMAAGPIDRVTDLPLCSNDGTPHHETLLRVKERNAMIQELKMKSDSPGVSIVGISGIGKTILARAIAEEASIKLHFPYIYNHHKLCLNKALDFIKSRQSCEDEKNRVLIVLDGLDSVTPEIWRHFWYQCELSSLEIKVLITTQNPRVAHVTGTSKHCLHPVSDDECFLLIQNGAKPKYKDLCEADEYAMMHNRKELIDMCRGLPLLANQIGLLLSAAKPGQLLSTIDEITASSPWKVPDLERVLVNLKSIFLQEPQLQRCLAYCSLFPEDYEFKEENLVQLWMAEGFTQPSTDANYLEKITRKYFDHLLSCSLLQASEVPPGEKPTYKMHDLAYDLAQNIASTTFCRRHVGKSTSCPEISSITRHFSLSCERLGDDDDAVIDQILLDIQNMCSGLRTFLLFHEAGKCISKSPTFFQRLTRLRVLDLSHTNLTKLEPKHISELKYLRYLDLSHTPVENLPKLSKNPELQVLKLNHCNNLLDLPKDLTKLTKLTSLQVNTRGLCSMPSGMGALKNLQRLDVFIVGRKKGYKIAELENLNNIRNSLHIQKLENVETKQEAQEAKLVMKRRLERLELEWSRTAKNKSATQVLEGLEPPKNLRELVIRNYCSFEFPEWLGINEVCGLLESIHLDHCKALPSIDQLPLLKTLCVEAMHEINHELFGRNGKSIGFPYIEKLVLCDMPDVKGWIEMAAIYMPRLCNLRVEKCQGLVTLPKLYCLTSLEKLEISRCMKLQELPVLPRSLKSLVIQHSSILKQRCQVGQGDWFKIRGIKVVIDSDLVDKVISNSYVQDQKRTESDQKVLPQLQSTDTNHNASTNDILQDYSSTRKINRISIVVDNHEKPRRDLLDW